MSTTEQRIGALEEVRRNVSLVGERTSDALVFQLALAIEVIGTILQEEIEERSVAATLDPETTPPGGGADR